MGFGGLIPFPAKSPDVLLLEILFWGFLKDNFYIVASTVTPYSLVTGTPN
jgi:hypothetical protein